MRNDAGLHARTPRTGRSSSFFPSSFRAISSYLRNVSSNASNIATTVRSAGASLTSAISIAEEEWQREQVQWAGFDVLEVDSSDIHHVLLLTYLNGFQVWDIEEADNVRELVSKRDGAVAFLHIQPRPCMPGPSGGGLEPAWPLLLVVTGDTANSDGSLAPKGCGNRYGGGTGNQTTAESDHFLPTVVRFYSLLSHTYVHMLRFPTPIYSVQCSSRLVAVALGAQIYCFDAATLKRTFSVLTYPSPQSGPGGVNIGYGAMAVGPRWLAYAANQPLVSNTGRVSPQHLTLSPGASPTSPANGSLVAHYAKESSKHLAAGIVTLGDMGYKTLSRYCSELLPDGVSSPGSGSPNWKSSGNGIGVHSHESEHAGTVIVRDFVSKTVIAQFRAHTSPLSALCFDPSGTLLVTASVRGHNLNIFRLTPPATGSNANLTTFDTSASYVHLYKLCRGITNAVIQDISFSDDSHWISVSSSRGTSHLFAISPFRGIVGSHTHGILPANRGNGIAVPTKAFPWWSSPGPVRSNHQAPLHPPHAVTLPVVSRIKNGNGGWRGTVSGAAAAAVGINSSSGAVAVVFHDGRGKNLESELGHSSLKDQLWVLSPPGYLIRYALRPSLGTDGLSSCDGTPNIGGMSASQRHELRVVVEPLQRWDVCRRPNWAEREEKVEVSGTSDAITEETMSGGVPTYGNGAITAGTLGSGRMGKEGMAVEESHRWFLSNAELQMHQAKPPMWAKFEISFHVFVGAASDVSSRKSEFGGEIEIEKIPTRIVEVRGKDLVPVFEQLKNVEGVSGGRDGAMEFSHRIGGLHAALSKVDNVQDGFSGANVGCLQVQHSSSASSSGSDGGLFGGTTTVLNDFYHLCQDSLDAHCPSASTYCDTSTSFGHQAQQSPTNSERQISLFGHVSSHEFPRSLQVSQRVPAQAVIGSPPMDIPKRGQQDAYEKSHSHVTKAGEGSLTCLGLQHRAALHFHLTGEAAGKAAISCENQVGTSDNSHIFLAHGRVQQSSSDVSAQNKWESHLLEGNNLPSETLSQELEEAAVLFDHKGNHLHEYDVAIDEVEMSDAKKSEDYGGEQGNDVWEQTVFSFAEDN